MRFAEKAPERCFNSHNQEARASQNSGGAWGMRGEALF